MADEQNTQTTQATEQTAALSGGGDPNTSTQSFAQNILGDVNPDGIVRKTGAQGAAKHSRRTRSTTSLRHAFSANARDFPARRNWKHSTSGRTTRNPQSRSPRKLSRCSQTARTQPRRRSQPLKRSCSPRQRA